MVDDAQKTTTLQPTGAITDANSVAQGLQPQSQSGPQQTSDQTVSAIKLLDAGGTAISLNGIPVTRTATVQPIAKSSKPSPIYGGVAIICLGIFAWLVYGLVRPRS